MEFYVASRFALKKQVKEIYKKLKEKGHKIIYDWTKDSLTRPYKKNSKEAMKIAEKSIYASQSCEVFVLISDKGGTDMYGELGSAITSKKPKIYVIGEHLDKSKFFFHPNVKRMKNIEDVIKDLTK